MSSNRPSALREQFERCGARHVVFFRLRDRRVDDVGCGLECGVKKSLVGLELLPGVDGAAARQNRQQQTEAGDCSPNPRPAPACPFGPRRKTSSALSPVRPAMTFGKAESFAIGGVAQIGPENSDRAISHAAVRVELESQCWRKVVGPFAIDNDRDCRSIGVT